MIGVVANSVRITLPIFLRDFSCLMCHWNLWVIDWKFLKECLDHFSKPSFYQNLRVNAFRSSLPFSRRWKKKGKALSKKAHVGSVVNTTQPPRQWTLQNNVQCVWRWKRWWRSQGIWRWRWRKWRRLHRDGVYFRKLSLQSCLLEDWHVYYVTHCI